MNPPCGFLLTCTSACAYILHSYGPYFQVDDSGVYTDGVDTFTLRRWNTSNATLNTCPCLNPTCTIYACGGLYGGVSWCQTSTTRPTIPTEHPTNALTLHPSPQPSPQPSSSPTLQPTLHPTLQPTLQPTLHLTPQPTPQPTPSPTAIPTHTPDVLPTFTTAFTTAAASVTSTDTNASVSVITLVLVIVALLVLGVFWVRRTRKQKTQVVLEPNNMWIRQEKLATEPLYTEPLYEEPVEVLYDIATTGGETTS